MGQQQSKDVLLYQHVNSGNIEGVKALRRDGARLEWIDKEGKTPLIVACMKPELHNVARTLIELGANVNAYGSGRHAGTPLHHAAKRGLEQTVKLLLAHGANALVLNDDYQTPLDVARVNGNCKVVRAIEGHIGLFSGWMREFYGPGFLELFAPRWLSRKVWAVIVPCGSLNRSKPFKLELAIYTCPQDSQPRTIIALWKAKLEEPKFNQADLSVVISVISNIPRRWRQRRGILSSQDARCHGFRQSQVKLGPANEGDKQQLQWFCNACKGIPQARHRSFPVHTQYPVVAGTAPSTSEDVELAMAINASLQSATTPPGPRPHASTSWTNPSEIGNPNASAAPPVVPVPPKGSSSGCEVKEFGSSGNPPQHIQAQNSIPYVVQTPLESLTSPASGPSAPPIADTMTDDGPIHYPSIDFTPVDISSLPATTDGRKEDADGTSSSCVICLDAPVEGACIPCGHMAGCMSCLNEIKAKKWGCPVCRTNIDQVIRLYAV